MYYCTSKKAGAEKGIKKWCENKLLYYDVCMPNWNAKCGRGCGKGQRPSVFHRAVGMEWQTGVAGAGRSRTKVVTLKSPVQTDLYSQFSSHLLYNAKPVPQLSAKLFEFHERCSNFFDNEHLWDIRFTVRNDAGRLSGGLNMYIKGLHAFRACIFNITSM